MRRVWILNHYAQEPGGAGGTRHHSLARHLPDWGWRASLVAASVEHNTGRQRLPAGVVAQSATVDAVDYLWLATPVYKGNGFSRIRNMLVYAWRAAGRGISRELPRPDVIIGSTVHPLAALAGWWQARRLGVPFVFEVRDLWPETLIDMGLLRRRGVVARLMRTFERFLYQRAALIVTLLPRAVDYISTLGVPAGKVLWVTNGADISSFPAFPAPAPRPVFSVMYFGSLGQANAMACIVEAMALLRARGETGIRLRIIGDGPCRAGMAADIERLGLSALVSLEPPVSKARIPELAAEADAFVLSLRDLPLYRFGISLNKLFDYLAASRPVVFAGNPVNNPVADAECGITVPPGDAAAIADALCRLRDLSPDERRAMGERGRAHVVACYDYHVLAGRLAGALDKLV